MGLPGREALRVFVGVRQRMQPLLMFVRLSKGSTSSDLVLVPKLRWMFSLKLASRDFCAPHACVVACSPLSQCERACVVGRMLVHP